MKDHLFGDELILASMEREKIDLGEGKISQERHGLV